MTDAAAVPLLWFSANAGETQALDGPPMTDAEEWEYEVHAQIADDDITIAAFWRSGDRALRLTAKARYGDKTMERFAIETNNGLGTVLRWRWVAKRFSGETFGLRAQYPMLKPGHFEAVAGVRDDDLVRWYLDQAQHSDDRKRPLNVHELRALVQGDGHLPRGRCKWLEIACDKRGERIALAACETCEQHAT